jgi:hypothetical protein
MKKIIFITIIMTKLFAPSFVQAQGAIFVSNLEQTPTGSAAIGNDAWTAQAFFILATDPNSYTLNSIQLLMNPMSGNPNGFTVSIYNTSGGAPQNDLGILSGPDPLTAGIYTYTSPGITLSAGVHYFVVVTAATPIAQDSYNWSAAMGVTQNGNLNINDIYYSSSDGSSWTGHDRQDVFQMAIYATEAPEPATLALAGLGLACLRFRRRGR